MIRATVVKLTGNAAEYGINTSGKRAEVVITGPVVRDGIPGKSIGLTAAAWATLKAAGVGKAVTLQLQSSGRTSSGQNRPAFDEPVARKPRAARKPKAEAAE